jgi:signal transduction histidine kinase
MGESSPKDPQEIGGIVSRVSQLGAATERLFSRVYTGLSRRSQKQQERAEWEQQRAELEARIEIARHIEESNENLRQTLHKRRVELEQLHGILAKLEEGIILQDIEGRIVFMNTAARDLLGSQKNFWESELGVLFTNFQSVTAISGELAPLGEPNRVQVNNRILGAQLAAVARNGGQRVGTMIVLRDVTHDALADRLKDQFVTALSHELKTPMTVIKGMSEVLMRQPEDEPPNRRLLETLSRNVDILDRMIVELLDVSEMGAGTFDIRRVELDMELVMWSVLNGLQPDLKKKDLDLMVMARNIDRLRVNGDDQRLRWAMGHLVQNSIHYTESGGHITVSAGLDSEHGENVVIGVADTGVGISEKDLPHVFERFYRGDPRDTRGMLVDPRGLGQGLFIARTVAEAHGGYLRVQSEVGQGSVFTLALPAAAN